MMFVENFNTSREVLGPQFAPGKIILVGELHGTAESPFIFSQLAKLAVMEGNVSLGFELPEKEIELIRSFVAKRDTKTLFEELLNSDFWTQPFQDGRTSRAMLDLIKSLGDLKEVSPGLRIFGLEDCFDCYAHRAAGERDAVMARKIRAERESAPGAIILTLTGSAHNIKGTCSDYKTMAEYLSDLQPLSVLLAPSSGSAWFCAMPNSSRLECQIQNLSGPLLELLRDPEIVLGVYDVVIDIGVTSASPPAFSHKKLSVRPSFPTTD